MKRRGEVERRKSMTRGEKRRDEEEQQQQGAKRREEEEEKAQEKQQQQSSCRQDTMRKLLHSVSVLANAHPTTGFATRHCWEMS